MTERFVKELMNGSHHPEGAWEVVDTNVPRRRIAHGLTSADAKLIADALNAVHNLPTWNDVVPAVDGAIGATTNGKPGPFELDGHFFIHELAVIHRRYLPQV